MSPGSTSRVRSQPALSSEMRAASMSKPMTGVSPGFTPEQRRHLFEPFYTTKVKGTGLGLAIVKRIVEAHGGQVAAGPETGSGAEILFTLPRS